MQARPVGLHACPAKQIAPHQHTRHQHLLYQRRRFLRNTQSAIYRRRTHPLCRAGHLNAIVKLDLASLSRYAVVSTHRERRVSLQSDKKKTMKPLRVRAPWFCIICSPRTDITAAAAAWL